MTLQNCALLFSAEGQYDQAVRVLGAAKAQLRAKLRRVPPFVDSLVERRLSPARAALDAHVVAAAWSEGEAMSLDDAVAYAYQQLGVLPVALLPLVR